MRIFEFVIASALFVASFWAMGAAFIPAFAGLEAVMFTLGLGLMTISFWLPTRRRFRD